MLLTSNRYATVTVLNSVTNTLSDRKLDSRVAFTFIEFLNYSKSLDNHVVNFSDYTQYLKNWNTATTTQQDDLATQVKSQFTEFLRTITLSYTTAEEKRYLSNIDYTNSDDIEIAAPFFANKIKQVVLYFADKRDTFKQSSAIKANKGTNSGTANFIRSTIIDALVGNDSSSQFTAVSALSSISSTLEIEIEEGYDINNDYFDLDPFEPTLYAISGDRQAFFTANTNPVDPYIFLDTDKAIINLINYQQITLATIPELIVTINTPDLTLLDNSDFIDYSTHTRENIRLLLNAQLIQNFTGTDFYYLSTNAVGDSLSGKLFEATAPWANLLNLHYPSTLTVPATATLYERDVGLFYRPSLQSILTLRTAFDYYQNTSLKFDNVYVFPDPSRYGNVSGLTKEEFDSPLFFNLNGRDIQRNISSNNAFGHSLVSNNEFTFESYNSREQNRLKSIAGELYNSGVVSTLVSDMFGNLFIGFKQQGTNYINNWTGNVTLSTNNAGLSSINAINNYSIKSLNVLPFSNTTTIVNNIPSLVAPASIYDNRQSNGNFYMYNPLSGSLIPLSAALANVITKYPVESNYIVNALHDLEIYQSTFVFTTFAYTLVDRVDYSSDFQKSPSIPLSLHTYHDNIASNVYLVDKNLFIATFTLVDNVSASWNSRQFNLNLYQYSIASNTSKQLTFGSSNTVIYTVNTKLQATNLRISYNGRQDVFNVVVDLKDLSRNIFIHNFTLKVIGNTVTILSSNIYSCSNSNCTINFYDNSNSVINTNILIQALSSTTPNVNNTDGTLQF